MRATDLRSALPVIGLLCGCSGDEGTSNAGLITPDPGAYQATLAGYTVQNCDASLVQPRGVLDASVMISPPLSGTITISGSRIWSFGPVDVRPGDPQDMVARLSWVGTGQLQTSLSGCLVQASVIFQYFPTDTRNGSLHVQQDYSSMDTCKIALPCENQAIWQFTRSQ